MITRDIQIEIIKRSIMTELGWKNLAASIKGAIDPIQAKNECLDCLTEIARDKSMQSPIEISLNELFVSQLENALK